MDPTAIAKAVQAEIERQQTLNTSDLSTAELEQTIEVRPLLPETLLRRAPTMILFQRSYIPASFALCSACRRGSNTAKLRSRRGSVTATRAPH